LIAHVRIAGQLRLGDVEEGRGLWLAEIIDSAYGPPAGALVLVGGRSRRGKHPADFADGECLILFASRDLEGVYQPLPGYAGRWPIDKDGKPGAHPLTKSLPPFVDVQQPADVVAWLWSEARQHDFEISVAINEDDLRFFERGKPLRLAITIDNTGGRPLTINNVIEFEYRHYRRHWLEAKLEKVSSDVARESADVVKVYAEPLQREHVLSDLQKALREYRELTLTPGERCAGEFDLGEEPQVYGGMRYQVWAEVGARRSPPIVLGHPGGDAEFELMEKLDDVWEDDGPFQIVARHDRALHTMPSVQSTDESQAIDAALSAWLDASRERDADRGSDTAEREIVLLGGANVPREFVGSDQRYYFVGAEPLMQAGSEPTVFTLQAGKAMFRGRALRVEAVEIGRQLANVTLREAGEGPGGALATVPLRRESAKWHLAGEIMLQQH
jgi:hypothetical protein